VDFRNSPSGPIIGRRIASGSTTIAAFSSAAQGPTFKRKGNERVWVYVYSPTLTATAYSLIAFPIKDVTMAIDEWGFIVFMPFGAPQPAPIVGEWIAYGGNP